MSRCGIVTGTTAERVYRCVKPEGHADGVCVGHAEPRFPLRLSVGANVILYNGRRATVRGYHDHPVYGRCYVLYILGVGPGGGWQDRDVARVLAPLAKDGAR